MLQEERNEEALALREALLSALPGRTALTEVWPELGSTNDRAKALALSGAPEGSLVVALTQTAGRGRQGRSFYSPAGTGAYMSLVLRPRTLTAPEDVTIAAAVAVARAAEALSARPTQIKWVNDVYLGGKKICGILTEGGAAPDGSPWAVVGIGVNLLPPAGGFPEELRETVGALLPQGDAFALRTRLIAAAASELLSLYARQAREELLREYRQRDFLRGKEVDIIFGNQTRKAQALGIADDFGLLVRFADGREEKLRSGEVHIRPAQGDGLW